MVYLRWTFWTLFWVLFGSFLHYSLPQYDVVRIVNTYEKRQDLDDWTRIFWSTPDAQSRTLKNRDVQFIQSVRPNDSTIVYRNEDTGWSWPPYFKFDTANLYTEANDAISTKKDPMWVAIMHYGWRNEFFSIFPNAVSLSEVDGPDDKPFNWFTYGFLILLAAFVWFLNSRWRRFRRERIAPVLDDVEEGVNAAGSVISEKRGRLRRWLDTWKAKNPKRPGY